LANNIRLGIISFISVTFLFLGGCASHGPNKPLSDITGYSESGIASYYAMKFQNRKTASGERFDNYSMTAAHRSLPFGSKVKVTNIRNGKSVKVIINDRGPYVKGRVIDLTQAAFAKIEKLDKGITKVELLVVN